MTTKEILLSRLPPIETVLDLTNTKMEFVILTSELQMKFGGVEHNYFLSVECIVEKQIGYEKQIEIKSILFNRIILILNNDIRAKFTIENDDLKEFINY